MLLKIPPNRIIRREYLRNHFCPLSFEKISRRTQSLNFTNYTQFSNFAIFFLCKDNFHDFIPPKYLCNSKISTLNNVFIMGNKRHRRSRRIESQSTDREENTSETSFAQGNATLVDVSENVNNIFDSNLGSN